MAYFVNKPADGLLMVNSKLADSVWGEAWAILPTLRIDVAVVLADGGKVQGTLGFCCSFATCVRKPCPAN